MATYTPVSKVIGTTGASGNAGYAAMVTAANTAIATAVTTALAVTGYAPQSLIIYPAVTNSNTDNILTLTQTLTYTVIS